MNKLVYNFKVYYVPIEKVFNPLHHPRDDATNGLLSLEWRAMSGLKSLIVLIVAVAQIAVASKISYYQGAGRNTQLAPQQHFLSNLRHLCHLCNTNTSFLMN